MSKDGVSIRDILETVDETDKRKMDSDIDNDDTIIEEPSFIKNKNDNSFNNVSEKTKNSMRTNKTGKSGISKKTKDSNTTEKSKNSRVSKNAKNKVINKNINKNSSHADVRYTIELDVLNSSEDLNLEKRDENTSGFHPSVDNERETVNKSSSTLIPIYAEEVRQYLYCKRIPYWRRIGSFSGFETKLMKRGREYHNQRSEYTHKRKNDINALRDKFYYEPVKKIGGKIDLLRVLDDQIIPVEIKRFSFQRSRPSKGHVTQAIIGGMAAEFEIQKPMHEIEIQYQNGIRSTISITDSNKNQVMDVVKEIRRMIKTEQLPKPTSHEKKCKTCEYWKICHRV